MKLRKYNEAFEEGHLYDKEGNDIGKFQKAWREEVERKLKLNTSKYDMLYLKTIFPEVLEDTKDLLDEYFVDALDRDAKTSISKVNKADHVGFFGRYRIVGNYAKGDKTLSGYAATFNGLSNDFLDIETGLKHLQAKFKDESIFGEEFPITTFTHTLNVTHNDRGISYEFILDLKF
jgi:hypothetical protein